MVLTKGSVPSNKSGIIISKLCGALATDGTIYKQDKLWNGYKETSYYFELADYWLENVLIVKKLVKSLIGKEGSIRPLRGCYRYRIGSKILVEYLHSLGFPYGKKARTVSIPKEILSKDAEFKNAFVCSAIMFDGSVKLDGTVEFTSASRKMFKQMVEILSKQKVAVKTYKRKFTRFSDADKYIFYSKSFEFFIRNLDGPKLQKLILVRRGMKLSINMVYGIFPIQPHSKIPIMKEVVETLVKRHPLGYSFYEIMGYLESKYNQKIHRNTLILYLNILLKSRIIKRISRGCYTIDPERIDCA